MSGRHVPNIFYLINLLGRHHIKKWSIDQPGIMVIHSLEQCTMETQFPKVLLVQTLIKFNGKGFNVDIWRYRIRLQNNIFNNGRSNPNEAAFCFTQKKLKQIKYEKR